jgi:hypothetical protein
VAKSITRKVKHDVEDALEDVGKALQRAADELTDDAEEAVAQAAVGLRHAAAKLADRTPPVLKSVARKAVDEVKQHPIASTAAALTAAAALISLMAARRKKPSA